jgi:hypothetical protein
MASCRSLIQKSTTANRASPALDAKVHIPSPLHQRVATQHFCSDGLLPLCFLLCCSPLSLCCALSSDALELGLELSLVI